jgi:nucleotide-binding universal stress UspA family protein
VFSDRIKKQGGNYMSQSRFQKILVPLDGSENSFRALSAACDLAENCNAAIEILYVVLVSKEIPAYTQINSSYIPDSVIKDIQEEGQAILNEGLKQVPPSIATTCSLELGFPSEKIIDISQNNNCDLIVIGSRGLGVIKSMLVGSVSSHVVHHATCPVMVVR